MLLVWQFIFYVSAALTLVVPSGHFVGPFFMAIAGLLYRQQALKLAPLTDPFLKASWIWLLGCYWTMVVIGLSLSVWHSNPPGHYQLYVPFIFFPAIAWLIRAGRWQIEPWLLSISLGAVLAFLYALYQVLELGHGRASGASNHPIPFGNTAIVLSAVASVSGVMFPFEGPHSKWKRLFVLLAGAAGAGASFLSGSRGGWLSLLMIGVTVAYLATRNWPSWRRHISAIAIISTLITAGLLAPKHVVEDRLVSGFNGGLQWLKTGEVTDGSVGMRLEIWRLSLKVIATKPWLGHGTVESHHLWEELSRKPDASPMLLKLYDQNAKFISFDNEWIGTLAGGGLVGSIGVLIAYLGVWIAFWHWRLHTDQQIKTLSTIGLLLTPMYLEFGLTVSVFGTNVFRSVFVMMSVSLLALITVRFNALKDSS
jgi:O-antigen ligase